VFTLPAKGQQIIRIALRRAVDPERELSYRLLLDEVPQPPSADFTGLQVALRLSLPVFVQPARRASAALVWNAAWQSDGHIRIKVRNEGSAHAQVLDFAVQAAGDALMSLHNSVARYVLPGSEAEWLLDVPEGVVRSGLLRIHGASDQGDFSAEFPATLP
jgi:fimbrial chaperone protein